MKTFVTRGTSDPFRTTIRFEDEEHYDHLPSQDYTVTLNASELYALTTNLQSRCVELGGE